MKRTFSLVVTLSLVLSAVGCCQRNRCCRSSCSPCGGGCGTGFGIPGAMPMGGYGPSGQIMNNTYSAVPAATTSGPVANATDPVYTQSAFTQTSYAPQTAMVPLNPLPTW